MIYWPLPGEIGQDLVMTGIAQKCELAALIIAYKRASRHYSRAAALYLELDAHEINMPTRVMLRRLRKSALSNQQAYAYGLSLLHASCANKQEIGLELVWRRLLAHLGTHFALVWLDWDALPHVWLLKILAKRHRLPVVH
jgi:hypothetical protein